MTKIIIFFGKFYQYCISPLYFPCCRFYPSCSNYFIQAVKKYGIKGIVLGLYRILKCNPFGGSGDDPVPDKFNFFNIKSKKNE